jgi:hypothetical protein
MTSEPASFRASRRSPRSAPVVATARFTACGACIGGLRRRAGERCVAHGFAVETVPDAPAVEVCEEQPAALRRYRVGPCRGPCGKAVRRHPERRTAADIDLAVREGYRSIEHVKRYTLLGFGTDQGKTREHQRHRHAAAAAGVDIAATGTTTFRPPYTPMTFGAVAGRNLGDVVRTDTQDAVARMARAARSHVRERRAVEAALVLPPARGGHAGGRRPRVPGCPQRACCHGRLHPGQDRHPRARCRRVPQPCLHQCLERAEGRPLSVRVDAG